MMVMRMAIPLLLFAAVSACAPAHVSGGVAIAGVAMAGPVCPVETIPPQAGCEDREAAGAVIIFQREDGTEAANATTAQDGTFSLVLPPGVYHLVPQPVEGLMGVAPEQDLIVVAGEQPELTIVYDTGIR